MTYAISALILAIMAGLSVFVFNRTTIKLLNFNLRTSNPIVRAVIGPIVMILAGFLCILLAYIFLSPILLFYHGHTYWAVGLLVFQAVLSHFTTFVRINNVPFKPTFPLDIPFGLLCFWVTGLLCMIAGMILASPVLLLI